MFSICKSMFLTFMLKGACTHLLIFFFDVTYYVALLLLFVYWTAANRYCTTCTLCINNFVLNFYFVEQCAAGRFMLTVPRVDWFSAARHCASMQATLVAIRTQSDQSTLMAYLDHVSQMDR